MVNIEFEFNMDENDFHFKKHNITEEEIREFILKTIVFEYRREDKSIVSYGKLKSSGKYIKVIYRKKKIKNVMNYFVITGYEITDNKIINHINRHIDY